MLSDTEASLRRAAFKALVRIEPGWQEGPAALGAIPGLVEELRRGTSPRKLPAAEALGAIGAAARSAVSALVPLLTAGPELAQACAGDLDAIDPAWADQDCAQAAAPALVAAVGADDEGSALAATLLSRFGASDEALVALIVAQAATHAELREAAAASLLELDPRWADSNPALEAVPALAEALRRPP